MSMRTHRLWVVLLVGCGCCWQATARAQDPPPVPMGVEEIDRGPIHEAFAAPTEEPATTKIVPKQPPKAIEEMPPEQKPDGDVAWIGGYWAWDDERNDFLWVSGIWRMPPPGRQWVAGYFKDVDGGVQWVPGFWAPAPQQQQAAQDLTYLPSPPAPPEIAPPGEPPTTESFYVPGAWEWRDGRYVWRSGYWARVQPGYVWVPAHYIWTPSGYVYVAGYWDLAISRRGVLFAPVVVDTVAVGPAFVYTPSYVVCDTVVHDALWVRPSCRHYYFGDYYGVTYQEYGFESCAVYSGRHYDAIFVYERYEHRSDPSWFSLQISFYNDRCAGRAPCPPRTLVQQNTIIQQNITNVTNVTNVTNNTNINRTNVTKNTVLMPASQMAAAKGGAIRTVKVDPAARVQAKQQAQAIREVAVQRTKLETPAPGGRPTQARAVSLNVPKAASTVSARPASANQVTTPSTGHASTGNSTVNGQGASSVTHHPTNVTGQPAANGNHGNTAPGGQRPITGPGGQRPITGPGGNPQHVGPATGQQHPPARPQPRPAPNSKPDPNKKGRDQNQ